MSLNDQPLAPKMPTSFDIVGMPDESFERMCFELIRLEFPGVVKPPNTRDGGADAGLPRDDHGYSRCWQAKHFKDDINWTKWKKSFNDACENWGMEEYTFCIPRELKEIERKTFDKHFRQPGAKVKVNYWSGAELHARLTSSAEGLRVARTFFDHSDLDNDRVLRAVQAQGPLDSVDDALDRMTPVGDFLQTRDPYFHYPASTQSSELAGTSPPPGTVMSVAKIQGGLSNRVDIVPQNDEALEHYGPRFRLQPSDDPEAAAKAWPKLQRALEEGRSIELGSGVDVTFTQMPPAFQDMVGQRITNARVQLTAHEEQDRLPPPFEARLAAKSNRGDATWDVRLDPAEAPDGWDHSFEGSAGGMTAELLLRKRDGRGQSMWNFKYSHDDSPAATQLAAMKFLRALSGTGEVVVSDRGRTNRPTISTDTEPREFPEVGDAVIALLEDVITVEEWTDVQLPVSSFSSAEEVHNLAVLAHGLREGGWPTTWHDMEFVATTEESLVQLRDGGVLVVEQTLWARLAGRELEIGVVRNPIKGYRIVNETPLPGGRCKVRLEPPDADSAKFFQQVGKRRRKKRPPPPPPRRGKQPKGTTTRNKKGRRGSKKRGKD
jgi:hypothetical protein